MRHWSLGKIFRMLIMWNRYVIIAWLHSDMIAPVHYNSQSNVFKANHSFGLFELQAEHGKLKIHTWVNRTATWLCGRFNWLETIAQAINRNQKSISEPNDCGGKPTKMPSENGSSDFEIEAPVRSIMILLRCLLVRLWLIINKQEIPTDSLLSLSFDGDIDVVRRNAIVSMVTWDWRQINHIYCLVHTLQIVPTIYVCGCILCVAVIPISDFCHIYADWNVTQLWWLSPFLFINVRLNH